MVKSILFYTYIQIRGSKFTYVVLLFSIFLIYYQTVPVEIRLSENVEFNGVSFTDGWTTLENYLLALSLHFFFFLFFLAPLLSSITHSFFNSTFHSYILVNNSKRPIVIIKYVISILILLTLMHIVYLSILNVYFLLNTGSLFFIASYLSAIYLFPQFFTIVIVITSFSILFKNSVMSLFAILLYLIVIPFSSWIVKISNFDLPQIVNYLIEYSEYLFPFHLDLYNSAYKASFSLGSIYNISDLLYSLVIFCVLALLIYKRRVY